MKADSLEWRSCSGAPAISYKKLTWGCEIQMSRQRVRDLQAMGRQAWVAKATISSFSWSAGAGKAPDPGNPP